MTNLKLLHDYLTLCKPKVVLTMLMTAWVGMQMASPNMLDGRILFFASLGIGLTGGAAAAINHWVDYKIDQKMRRTKNRPIAKGRIKGKSALIFAGCIGSIGLGILATQINLLTAYLSFVTLIAYAVFYTVFLKHATPQNIVIGGLAGATPPMLGWVAVSNQITPQSLILALIIFVWTPPHFWALAIDREQDYARSKIPMLPNTHGVPYTKLCILLYTFLLCACTLLPYVVQMSGNFYLISVCTLNIIFLNYAMKLYFASDNTLALKLFAYSIWYILLLFLALLVDYYLIR